MKYIIVDTETTGVDPQKHHIWQLSGKVLGEDLEELEKFNFTFSPISLHNFDTSTSEVTNMTAEDLLALPMTAKEAYRQFISILERHCNRYDKTDKMQMVGYNLKFDSEFIRQFFVHNGDNYFGSWFWTPGVCLMYVMSYFLMERRQSLVNFKLGTLCKMCNIEFDDSSAHDAMYDVNKTHELFKFIRDHF